MRKIVAVVFFAMVLQYSVNAQSLEYKQGVTVKRVFTDYRSLQGGDASKFRTYRPTWELGYTRRLAKQLHISVPLRAGVFTIEEDEARNVPFVSLDGQVQYFWRKPHWHFIPYVTGGIGFVKEFEGSFLTQVPIGAGLFIKINEQAYIHWQSEYRVAFDADRANFQHGLGFTYLFGPRKEKMDVDTTMDAEKEDPKDFRPDSDGDGIPDEEDLCPKLPGLEEFTGCPDTDGDGIHDLADKCPEISGLKEMGGCPDSDGDGLSDNEDDCPNMAGAIINKGCPRNDDDNDGIPNNIDECPFDAGTVALNGCPDSDGDGVADKNDRCPNVAGLVSTQGCPIVGDKDNDGVADNQDACPDKPGLIQFNGCPDTDGDGLDDSRDGCPTMAGPESNGGCPIIAKEDKKTLEVAMRAVQFDLGKSTLKQESFRILNQVAEVMRRYPDYNLIISGHTDSSGSVSFNQRLSERRAQTCYEYLINRNISSKRMRYTGYGESRPISDNRTKEGMYLNRRVEFELIPGN